MQGGERIVTYGITAAIILGLVLHAAGTAGIMSVGFSGLNSVFGTLSGSSISGTQTFSGNGVKLSG